MQQSHGLFAIAKLLVVMVVFDKARRPDGQQADVYRTLRDNTGIIVTRWAGPGKIEA